MIAAFLAAVLSLHVIPFACFSPCEVRATVYVEGSRDGDKLTVEFDSEEYHKSEINIREGRRTYQLPLTRLVGDGQAAVVAILTRRDGSTWRQVQFIELKGSELQMKEEN